MGLLKFLRGKKESSLSKTTIQDGAIYHCEDTGNTYVGNSNGINMFASSVGKTILNNDKFGEIFNDYNDNSATGSYSHAEGSSTAANGDYSHVEGYNNVVNGNYSHAEGASNTITGNYSHGEGFGTQITKDYSHTEGYNTQTTNNYSHAEGAYSIAKGSASHAEGYYTVATGQYQHVSGKYNIEDTTNKYACIVGNGSSSVRSNAYTLDWEGNAWFKGDVFIDNLSTNKVLITNEDKQILSSSIDKDQLLCLEGINSNIQLQLNNRIEKSQFTYDSDTKTLTLIIK